MTPRLRLAVVLPGGLSFGAYEAGVCSSLVEVVKASQGELAVDLVVGSSCGAVTGLLAALALRHEDALPYLQQLWVDRVSLRWMLWPRSSTGPWAPLSTVALERWAHTLFSTVRGRAIQEELVRLVIALAPLDGVEVDRSSGPNEERNEVLSPGWSYQDARRFLLGDDPADWVEALDAVLASAAHPVGFAPRQLHDEGSLRETSWFTDGGASDNMPLHLAIDVLGSLPRDGAERLVVVVYRGRLRPLRTKTPTFVSTGLRALSMVWNGLGLVDLLRDVDVPAPVMIVSPDTEALEGMAWANVRGFFSKAIRQRDFARGRRDFLDRWLHSPWSSASTDPPTKLKETP